METVILYNLEQIQSIYENNNFILNDDVKNVINHLERLIPDEPIHNVPLIRSDRSFDRRNRNRRGRGINRGYSSNDINIDDWEAIRDFKPTEKKEALGLDKEINELRSILNKVSNTNYEIQKNIIVEKIQELFENDNFDDSDKEKIVNSVFDTCCTTKFLSEVYTDLYVEIIGHNDNFGNKLDNFIEIYKNGLNNIKYIDPDEDYNGFCDYNTINEIRKANSMFIVNLMKREMISRQEFIDLLLYMQNRSIEYISMEGKVHEVEEITENIFLFVKNSKDQMTDMDQWNEINENIKKFISFKTKDYSSLSNRCRFKYMDM